MSAGDPLPCDTTATLTEPHKSAENRGRGKAETSRHHNRVAADAAHDAELVSSSTHTHRHPPTVRPLFSCVSIQENTHMELHTQLHSRRTHLHPTSATRKRISMSRITQSREQTSERQDAVSSCPVLLCSIACTPAPRLALRSRTSVTRDNAEDDCLAPGARRRLQTEDAVRRPRRVRQGVAGTIAILMMRAAKKSLDALAVR